MNETVARLHRAAPLTDVHVHPSLNLFLWGQDFWRDYGTGKGFMPLLLRSGYPYLQRGAVGVIWAAHYVPESEIIFDCAPAHLLAQLLPPVTRLQAENRFVLLTEMMDLLESAVAAHPERAEIARSPAEVVRIRNAGKLAIVHTVEGAHALAFDFDNVERLRQRGVASLTLAHFFYNHLFSQVVGIPAHMLATLRALGCDFDFQADLDPPVTGRGLALLDVLRDAGIIVDVCHLTPAARRVVYQRLGGAAPIVATHTGVRTLQPLGYDLDDDDVRSIADSGGAVGVILMVDWLKAGAGRNGLDALWETLWHIRTVTGTWDHAMIGSDLDGFTDPPDDCYDASMLGRITQRMLDEGVDEGDVKKVLGGNAQRVLEAGWKGG
jgi:membrane dipeptidase